MPDGCTFHKIEPTLIPYATINTIPALFKHTEAANAGYTSHTFLKTSGGKIFQEDIKSLIDAMGLSARSMRAKNLSQVQYGVFIEVFFSAFD